MHGCMGILLAREHGDAHRVLAEKLFLLVMGLGSMGRYMAGSFLLKFDLDLL